MLQWLDAQTGDFSFFYFSYHSSMNWKITIISTNVDIMLISPVGKAERVLLKSLFYCCNFISNICVFHKNSFFNHR